jgi:hypothetical protein
MRSLKPVLIAIAVIVALALFASLAINNNSSQASMAPNEASVDFYADDDPMQMEIPNFKDEVCGQESFLLTSNRISMERVRT